MAIIKQTPVYGSCCRECGILIGENTGYTIVYTTAETYRHVCFLCLYRDNLEQETSFDTFNYTPYTQMVNNDYSVYAEDVE